MFFLGLVEGGGEGTEGRAEKGKKWVSFFFLVLPFLSSSPSSVEVGRSRVFFPRKKSHCLSKLLPLQGLVRISLRLVS